MKIVKAKEKAVLSKMRAAGVEILALADLKVDPRQARANHDTVGIMASLRRFGQVEPLIVLKSDRRVIGGNGRLGAMRQLGWAEAEAKVVDLDEREATALAVALNRLGDKSRFDEEALARALEFIGEESLETVEGLGFDFSELEQILGADDLEPDPGPPAEEKTVDVTGHTRRLKVVTDPEAPEPPKTPTTKLGDVWTLGRHKLICGDSAMSVHAPDARIILTDPPYSSGSRQDASKKNSTSIGSRSAERIARDNLTTSGYLALIARVLANVPKAECLYLFTDWRMWHWTFDTLESSGFPVRNMIVWDKGHGGMGFPWRSQHELIAFAKKTASKMGDGVGLGNVRTHKRTGNDLHPTQKPVELIAELLQNTSDEGQVFDPFGGSGSTLIACEQVERACVTVELDPGFCDVIVQRWETLTGGKATRS